VTASLSPPLRVTFIFSEYSLHNDLIEHHLASRPADVVSLIKVPLVLRGRSRAETVTRIAPRLSRRFLTAKLLEALLLQAITLTPKCLPRGAVFRRLRWIATRRRLPFLRTDDIMSGPALDFLRDQRPDLVVTLFHQILRNDLLRIPRLGVVNAHPGLLPAFAGIQPYFWALSEGAAETGGTLHLIEDETVDTGRVLGEARFRIAPGMSVQLAYYLTCRSLAHLLPGVVGALADGTLCPRPQLGGGAYHRWPDSAAMTRLKQRGHSVFSFRDMARMLAGRFDNFTPEHLSIEGTTPQVATAPAPHPGPPNVMAGPLPPGPPATGPSREAENDR
jgi:methionyl-tRNA formyltransferase